MPVQILTASGTWDWEAAGSPDTVEVWIIAAGGGVELANGSNPSGGGGAGGVLYLPADSVAGDIAFTIGAGVSGGQGQNTVWDTGGDAHTAIGGGFGANNAPSSGDGGAGGSGGGGRGEVGFNGGGAGTPGQGNNGGIGVRDTNRSGGGGGGYSEVGADGVANATTGLGGNGGDGIDLSAVVGTSVGDAGWFAGGGGGGSTGTGGTGGNGGGANGVSGTGVGVAGQANTGGGAGGGRATASSAAAGGSGVIIVRYSEGLDVPVVDAAALSCSSILVSWTEVAPTMNYRVERSLDGLTGWSSVAIISDDTEFTDTGLDNDTEYFYRVQAYLDAEESDWSTPVSDTTDPLLAPTVIVSVLACTDFSVEWDSVDCATGYRLERSPDGTSWEVLETNTTEFSYLDLLYPPGTTRYYRVTALNTSGESPPSTPDSATTGVLGTPTAPVLNAISCSTIEVTWASVSCADNYLLERRPVGETEWVTAYNGPELEFVDTGLPCNTDFEYRLIAQSDAGDGETPPPEPLILIFTESDTFDWEAAGSPATLEDVWIIAGGGGGAGGAGSGASGGWKGGGGGAGGLLHLTDYAVSGDVPVVVGLGGNGGLGGGGSSTTTKGGNSSFDGQVAAGGGKGAIGTTEPGGGGNVGGGCGGGGTTAGSITAGNGGAGSQGGEGGDAPTAGNAGGGGGGINGDGQDAQSGGNGGDGGPGIDLSAIVGTLYGDAGWFGGGGGGNGPTSAGVGGQGGGGNGAVCGVNGASAVPNSGGGGGGAGCGSVGGSGGDGADGIVIVRVHS